MKNNNKICILVGNDVTSDPRVTREAKTLAKAGYKLLVCGLRAEKETASESKDGYKIIRLSKILQKKLKTFFLFKKIKNFLLNLHLLKRIINNRYFHIRVTFRLRTFIRDHIFILKTKFPLLARRIEFLILLNLLIQRTRIFIACKRLNRFNYYHANDMDTLIAGYILAKRNKGILIYDAHEIWPHQNPGRNSLTVWLLEQVERFFIKRAEVVITVNKLIANHFYQRYKLKKVPYVLMNCPLFYKLNKKRIEAEKRKLKQKFSLNSEVKIVLYQGKFAIQRGIEDLIDASKFFSKDLILIVRGPENDYYQKLVEYARERKILGTKVFFDSPVAMEEMIVKGAAVDIGILNFLPLSLNNYYILPNKIFEYMAAGLAVASSNMPALSELIRKWRFGIIIPRNNPKGIARKLNSLCANDNHLSTYKKNSLKAAQVLFNWQIEKNKLLQIYSNISKTIT